MNTAIMSRNTSEQRLSGLEHSQKPVLELLDEVTEILRISWRQFSVTSTQILTTPTTDQNPRFREQWALRWLIKRLGSPVGFQDRSRKTQGKSVPDQPDNGLIQDARTWFLLCHLLSSIPKAKVQEILTDRKFFPILDAILNLTLHKLDDSSKSDNRSASSALSDDESGRPRKKRKVSADLTESATLTETQLSWPTLARRLVHIVNLSAMVLSERGDEDKMKSGAMTLAWADNIDAASTLVGNIIKTTYLVLERAAELNSALGKTGMNAAVHWLHLWSRYSSSSYNTSKQGPYNLFNTFLLVPVLSLLSLKPKIPASECFQALERQVSNNTILPARLVFKKEVVAMQSSRGNILRDKDIERLVREVRKVIQPNTEDNPKLKEGVYTSMLLEIASRLIPRSDIVQRKSESAWFEMLFVCLVQIMFSSGSRKNELHLSIDFKSNPEKHRTLEQLVDTFSTLDIAPSSTIWHYFQKFYILGKGSNIPYTLLLKIVKLNASVFIIDSDVDGSEDVDAIDARIPLSMAHDTNSYKSIVVEILCSLMNEYAKTRQFPLFLGMWKKKLAETFHERMAVASTSTNEQQRYIWDDPNVLKAFTIACRQYAPPSLCKKILEEAGKELQSLPTIVGPTHQIFVQLTIATQVLKSGVLQLPSQRFNSEQFQALASAVCPALARSTDYQGHRWRLYNFLATIVQSDSDISWIELFERPKIIESLTQNIEFDGEASSASKRCAALMEGYHFLHLVVSSFDANHTGVKQLLNDALLMVQQPLQTFLENTGPSLALDMAWDGTVEGIGSLDAFLSACIARLTTMSLSWLSSLEKPDKLVTGLTRLVLQDRPSRRKSESYLTNSAETLLRSLVGSPITDVPSMVMQAFMTDEAQRARRLPTLLETISCQKTYKSMTELGEFLLKHLAQEDLTVEGRLLPDSLALLSSISSKDPDVFGTKATFKQYLSGLRVSNTNADLMTLILTIEQTEKFARTLTTKPQSAEAVSEWRKTILNICKITKKDTKGFKSDTGRRLLNNYDDFLLVAVVTNLHGTSSRLENSEMDKIINKIESRLRKQALEEISNLIEEKPTVIQILKSTKLLSMLFEIATEKFLTEKNIAKIRGSLDELSVAISKVLQQGPKSLELMVLKSMKVKLSRLIALHQSVLGSSLPVVALANEGLHCTRRGDLEVQACLALDPSYLLPDITCTPLVTLVATGNRDAFQEIGLSDDTKLLFVIGAIVKKIKSETLSQSLELVKALGQIASLESALHSWSPVGLIFRLELSKMILESHANIVNQHIIDSTLCNVTLLTCSATKLTLKLQKDPHNFHPQHIFDRLCEILTTILTRYRHRLTGRHHLLLAALQSLMKCLFYPPRRQSTTMAGVASKAMFLASLPHWLNPPSFTSPHTLPVTSAMKFSRILQMLCDPSTSSARRVSKRHRTSYKHNNLVDETKLLRRQVSQHVQYLLQTYCQSMLDGWISPEVREKLVTLGLFAVCNAMDVEVMRAMNSAMGESQRAIWKDLYAEWNRWGKWNQR